MGDQTDNSGRGSGGVFNNAKFIVPDVSNTDMTAAYPSIGMDAAGNLFYDKTGSQSAT
jgi:hypothetical protein